MIVHPRDPFTRIDILPTDRKIRVDIDGKTIADCQAGAMSLWETNLPVRWYVPKTAVSHGHIRFLPQLQFIFFSSTGNILPSQIRRLDVHTKAGQGTVYLLI